MSPISGSKARYDAFTLLGSLFTDTAVNILQRGPLPAGKHEDIAKLYTLIMDSYDHERQKELEQK
jgi:hypothetical protein